MNGGPYFLLVRCFKRVHRVKSAIELASLRRPVLDVTWFLARLGLTVALLWGYYFSWWSVGNYQNITFLDVESPP